MRSTAGRPGHACVYLGGMLQSCRLDDFSQSRAAVADRSHAPRDRGVQRVVGIGVPRRGPSDCETGLVGLVMRGVHRAPGRRRRSGDGRHS
jgi:hypothetical protein